MLELLLQEGKARATAVVDQWSSGKNSSTILQLLPVIRSGKWVKVSTGASNNRSLAALSIIHIGKSFWTSSWAARPCYSSHFHRGRLCLVSNGNISTVAIEVETCESSSSVMTCCEKKKKQRTHHRLVQGALSGEDVRESLVEGFFFFF